MAHTVLVVDDLEGTRQRLRRILSGEGYRVVEASDGRKALRLLASSRTVDAILLDLVMPDMSGWTFRHSQLADPRLATIPTVFLTEKPLTVPERYALRTDAVVAKPFEDREMAAAVRKVLVAPAVRPEPVPTYVGANPAPLLWSKRGVVACNDHAPQSTSERWHAEGWARVPALFSRRYACQFCGSGPIVHRRARRPDSAAQGAPDR
jgi:two-component system, chemotaxis family, chemotaxis protein CheY